MNSIRARLVTLILIPVLIFGIVLSFSASKLSRDTMTQINGSKMTHQLGVYASLAEETLNDVESDVDALSHYMQTIYLPRYLKSEDQPSKDFAIENLNEYLRELQSVNPKRNYFVYYLDESGQMPENTGFGDYGGDSRPDPMPQLSQSYFHTDTLSDEKAWFFTPIQTSRADWFGPLIKFKGVKNPTLMVYSAPIAYGGRTVAVVGVDYPLIHLQNEIEAMVYHDTGYVVLLDNNLKIISHPTLTEGKNTTQQLGPDYAYIDETFREKDFGALTYRWKDDRDKVMYFKTLENGWKVVLTAYSDEVLRASIELQNNLIIVIGLCLLVCLLLAIYLGGSISRPIKALSEEIKALNVQGNRHKISQDLLNRKDQIGRISRLLEQRYNLLSNVLENIQHHTDHLNDMVRHRHQTLIEANASLVAKKDLISAKQADLKEQNTYLEKSIQTMLSTQTKLIEQEKLASFTDIINNVASEIKPTLSKSEKLIFQLDLSITKLTRQMLRSEFSRSGFIEVYETCKKNNRQLIGNLIFSKDIIDYIKDLTAAKSFKERSIIELGEYLEKCQHQIEAIPLEQPVHLLFHRAEVVYLEVDATKFLHLLSSLLIHIVTGLKLNPYPIYIKIQHQIRGEDLRITLLDNTFFEEPIREMEDSEESLLEHHLGISMIQLLMKEAFGGSLEIYKSPKGPGNRYELVFPQVLFTG